MHRSQIAHIKRICRRWCRKIHTAREELMASSAVSNNRRDYAWQQLNKNPLIQQGDSRTLQKKSIQIWIIIICTTITLFLLLFNQAFQIKNIHVSGTRRIATNDVVDSIYASLSYKKFFLFPGSSFLVVDVDEIRNILENKFPIEKIKVIKSFPNSISIVIEEKVSNIIYDNGKQYSYVGLDGKVVEVLRTVGDDEWIKKIEQVTSTNEFGEEILEEKIIDQYHKPFVSNIIAQMGDYPIVYNYNPISLNIHDEVIQEAFLNHIVEWYNLFEKETDIPFGYIEVQDKVGDAILHTREGWGIWIRLDSDTAAQFERLKTVLNNKVKRPQVQYIDVRYQDRVYWQ